MIVRNLVRLGLCALALAPITSAQGQASFTIRRPPDGSTVREKVNIDIPRSSVRPGGFVAFYIDDKFYIAVSPPDATDKPFLFPWDTKASGVSDGEHTIRAVLFEPVAGTTGSATSVTEKATSEVKLVVANKVSGGPTSLLLRYKYREGENLEYARESKAVVVGGESATGPATGDQELNSVRSKLLLGIEDARPSEDVNLVRNKLLSLQMLNGGQEITLDPAQLSESMYQELNARGEVLYETGGIAGLLEFTLQGLPVNNSLELPLLPVTPVSVGQIWRTQGQRLDIPGLPPLLQPRVTFENKFEGLEWEGGYPTAKVRQTYKGSPMPTIQFGPISVTGATIDFERLVYIAYRSGTLVKTARTMKVTGRTSDAFGETPAAANEGGGSSFGGGSSPFGGNSSIPGAAGMATGRAGGGPPPGVMSRYGGAPAQGGRAGGGPPAGVMSRYGGGPGQSGAGGGRSGPPAGVMNRYGGGPGQGGGRGGRGGKLGGGGDGDTGGGSSSPFGRGSSPFGRGGNSGGGGVPQETDHPITIKSTSDTVILSTRKR